MTAPAIVLCPGQGAQAVGMGKAWYDASAVLEVLACYPTVWQGKGAAAEDRQCVIEIARALASTLVAAVSDGSPAAFAAVMLICLGGSSSALFLLALPKERRPF